MELRDFISAAAKDDQLLHELQHQELTDEQRQAIAQAEAPREKVIAILKTVRDPEMPVNIWDLGLVYRLELPEADHVTIDMTLTAPTCPVAGAMPVEVEKRIRHWAPEMQTVTVNLVWEPRWNKAMMSEDAQLLLDMW